MQHVDRLKLKYKPFNTRDMTAQQIREQNEYLQEFHPRDAGSLSITMPRSMLWDQVRKAMLKNPKNKHLKSLNFCAIAFAETMRGVDVLFGEV